MNKSETLKTKTVKNIGWSGISQVVRLVLQFVSTAVLARLLTPKDFGLMAMIVVFTNFIMIFSDFGLTAALIQRKELNEEHLSSSFWINVLTGLFLTLLLIALAPVIANFYEEDKLTLIIMVLASTFFISSFGIVQAALIMKGLKFKSLAIIEILSVVISVAVAMFLAFSGFGVWSLVWRHISASLVTLILLWFFSTWKPNFLLKWLRVKELLNFSLNLTGFKFVNYFSRNIDNLLIGKLLGSSSLGFYNLAYRLLLFPITNISRVIGRVMFPSFSFIQEDKNKVSRGYLKVTCYIAIITFPLMIGLLVVAPQFIRVIFGSQWYRSIFLVQILAIVGLIQSIGTLNGTIYQSQGRTDLQFYVGIIFAIIVGFSLAMGLRWDIEGVTVAYAIVAFLLIYPSFVIPFRLIDLKFKHFLKQFNSIFFAIIGMGGFIFGLRIFLENIVQANDLIILILISAFGLVSYISILFVLNKNLVKEIFQLFKQLK